MNKLVPLLLVLNLLLQGGVVALLLLRRDPAPTAPDATAEAPADAEEAAGAQAAAAPRMGPVVRLPDFVVHLRNPEVDRYARLSIELELAADSDREIVTAYMPKLRDALLAWLSDRTLEEMRGSEGMEFMKASMLRTIDENVPGRPVRAVYIADFVVQ